jgi:hypothetical protein
MRRDVEMRHYDRFGLPVRPPDSSGHYVLKIVWHRTGQELRLAERSGWMETAPAEQKDLAKYLPA